MRGATILAMALAMHATEAPAQGLRLLGTPGGGATLGAAPPATWRMLTPMRPGMMLGDPSQQCLVAIGMAERSHGLPPGLLEAIGKVETGRRRPDGRIAPWPYSINVEGVDHVYETKPEVLTAVADFLRDGVRSIDVGCLQINLLHHPNAFASLDEAFDPVANARYAADFLVRLRAQTGSWEAATADYHSATPELGGPYAAKVDATWRRKVASRASPPDPACCPVGLSPAAHPRFRRSAARAAA